jgi:hypothetical protein
MIVAPRASGASVFPAETKYFDVGISAAVTSAGTTWASTEVPAAQYVNSSGTAAAYTDSALIPSAVGSAYGQVDGNRYLLKKIRVRGVVSLGVTTDGADALNPTVARIVLVLDTQPNGVQAQGEDIFQDIGAAGYNVYSYQRIAGQAVSRFRVLKDETFVLQPAVMGTDGVNTNTQAFQGAKFNWKYQPKDPLRVSIASGNAIPTVAGLLSHNIFMLAYAVRSGAAVALQVDAASRAYYCD